MSETPRGQLLRLLGVTFGVAVAMGEMIGPGILRTPGLVASLVPFAAAILGLWAFGALHAALQANVMAELATMLPRAGGQYVFVQRAFGAVGGVTVGWTMWCAHLVGIAASSIAFADFLGSVWPGATGHSTATAVAMQVALFGANVVGLREGRALQVTTTALKVLLLLLFVCAAVWLSPARPPTVSAPVVRVGYLAIAGAYLLIRGAYNGWLAPVYFAEENVRPARSIPRSLFSGVVMTGALYLGVNAALLHALGPSAMASGPLPYLTALERIAGNWISVLFAIGAMITAASCANANMMIAPRVLFALSRDGLLPAPLQAVNSGGSPALAFVFSAVVAIALATTGGFRFVFGMIGTLATLACLITEVAYFLLRAREPERARPWRAVFHPWLPGLVVAIDAVLLVLFALADTRGALFAALLCTLCIPFALVARRKRAHAP